MDICSVINEMISYYKGDVKRINHFVNYSPLIEVEASWSIFLAK